MSQERQLNMIKPVPGEPLFSSPVPHQPPLSSPSPLIPCCSPFLLPACSWPLQVHFSPLMQIALCSLHIYDLLPPLLNMRLRTGSLECCQSHWISDYQWSDNLSVRVSEEQTLEHKHSRGGLWPSNTVCGTQFNKDEEGLVNVYGCHFSPSGLSDGTPYFSSCNCFKC